MTYAPNNSQGQFLDYTITIPQDAVDMNLKLTESYQQIASAVNNREISVYTPQELPNGQQYFNNNNTQLFRNVYRKVIDFGTLPNATTKSVAHNVTFDANTVFTHVYGAATDPTGLVYIPLPYASPTDSDNIELYVDSTNVNVITGKDQTAFTICYIVLEYIKG